MKMVSYRGKFFTDSGIEVKKAYTPDDLKDANYLKIIGNPGEYPFTRGIYPDMYRASPWTKRQYGGYETAENTNKRLKFHLEHGASVVIALDLPTQLGLDSDNPIAEGEVGKVGVAIDSLKDLEDLFEGIPLNIAKRIHTTANAISAIWISMLIALAEKQRVSTSDFEISLHNDILKEYVARGTYIFPIRPSLKIAVDVIQYCTERTPNWCPLTVCGYHMREAGANAIQEMAFTIANAIAYIQNSIERGMEIDSFASQLQFQLSASMDLFEEVSKFRASRRLWAKIMKERFGAKDPKSMSLKIYGVTSGASLTAQQPLNNIVRIALEGTAAVLGGVQNLLTLCMDEGYSIPTEEASRVSIMTQHIIEHESGITKTVDPLGGSYYVEALTNTFEEEILKYIDKIEKMGGAVRAIENGFFQKEIAENAFKQQKEIESGERVIVGLNKYKIEEEVPIKMFKVDPKIQKKQMDRLKEVKKNRNNDRVKKILKNIKDSANDGENIVPSILNAVKEYATIGEITDSLKDIFGEHREEMISI
jgi:methylmalonyl-CoA mutase N-terminal domain/subunit